MGCCNANVKEDNPKEQENNNNNNKENIQNNNQEEVKSNLDDNDNDNYENNIYKDKYDGTHIIKEEDKGILNMYTHKIFRPKKYKVPNIVIINPKIPEDKKPPDLTKLKKKKKENVASKEYNIIDFKESEHDLLKINILTKKRKKRKVMKI